MGISFSNIGTVGREQLITSGSNGEPNWSYIPSKGKSTKKGLFIRMCGIENRLKAA